VNGEKSASSPTTVPAVYFRAVTRIVIIVSSNDKATPEPARLHGGRKVGREGADVCQALATSVGGFDQGRAIDCKGAVSCDRHADENGMADDDVTTNDRIDLRKKINKQAADEGAQKGEKR